MTDDLDRDQDLIAAETFLIGYVKEEKSGFHKRKTHKKGSTEEKFCRAALIRLLRDQERPLDPGLRDILADMFELILRVVWRLTSNWKFVTEKHIGPQTTLMRKLQNLSGPRCRGRDLEPTLL